MATAGVVTSRRTSQIPAVPALEEPWHSLRSAYHSLRQRWAAALAGFDLSVSEYVVLDLCTRGPAKASEVARAIGVTPAGATDVIDRLERRHLVRRVADPDDRRAVRVLLTPLGGRSYRETKTAVRTMLHALGEAMTDTERRALTVGLTALVRALPRGPA